MANHVTTEWEDIHVKLGNYVPTEEKPEDNDKIQELAIETIKNYDPLKNKTLDQLNELGEDIDEEEDDYLKQYKEKRIKEMKELAAKPHFGKLYELKKEDYIQEVNNAPKDVYVILLLYQEYLTDSNKMDQIFSALAKKYVLVKFMRIKATSCIEKITDVDVPAVIIYHNGSLFKQFIPASLYFGGAGKITQEKVEWILGSLKIIQNDLTDDPFEENEYVSINKGHKRHKEDDCQSDSDDENRFTQKGKEY